MSEEKIMAGNDYKILANQSNVCNRQNQPIKIDLNSKSSNSKVCTLSRDVVCCTYGGMLLSL